MILSQGFVHMVLRPELGKMMNLKSYMWHPNLPQHCQETINVEEQNQTMILHPWGLND